MSRSVKKGPFVEARLLGRVEEMNKRNEKKVVEDLVARVGHLPDLHRPHHRRPQRPEARPGLRDREHGRPPPRRVRPTRNYRGHGKHTDRSTALK